MEALIKIVHPRIGQGWREGWAVRGEGNGRVTIYGQNENVLFDGSEDMFLSEIAKGRIECDEESLDAFFDHWQV